jgi:hypothetical protein
MRVTTVSPLRQRMIEDMSLRNLAPRTQEAYIRGCKKRQRSCAARPRRQPARTSGAFSCISPSRG